MSSPPEFFNLFKIGFLKCDVPEEIMDFTRKEVKRMLASGFKNKNSHRSSLAGVIEHEYRFTGLSKALNAFFTEMIPLYIKEFENDLGPTRIASNEFYQIPEESYGQPPPLWINFQKKYEHNPIHAHSGHLSFVYWVKIPYSLEKEANLPHTKVDSPQNQTPKYSTFAFHFPSIIQPTTSNIYTHPLLVDETWEGKMIIFPSWLHHSVAPFYTSDDYRISVSGNLHKIIK